MLLFVRVRKTALKNCNPISVIKTQRDSVIKISDSEPFLHNLNWCFDNLQKINRFCRGHRHNRVSEDDRCSLPFIISSENLITTSFTLNLTTRKAYSKN